MRTQVAARPARATENGMGPPRNDGTPKRGVLYDDYAVLLVDELVHLGMYLLDGGLHLLAVDYLRIDF